MKRRLLVAFILCALMAFVLAFTVSAECEAHDYDWTLTLGSKGFLGEIEAKGICETCNSESNEKIPALFITRGYSYSDDGGISQGYGVNRDAIARYEQLSGEKVRFGGVLAIRDVIGTKNPLDAQGNPTDEYVQKMEFTDTQYDIINVMVQGVPQSQYDKINIICALYVTAGGNTTYIDNRAVKVNCGQKTFNQVKEAPIPDISSANEYVVIDGVRYRQLNASEFMLTQGKYWNNEKDAPQADSKASFNNKFWTSGIYFTEETLPVGSIIILEGGNGWQYRPHKWSGTRPDNTMDSFVKVDEAWWSSYTKVGFNISKIMNGKDWSKPTEDTGNLADISGYTPDEIMSVLKILVPASAEKASANYSYAKQNWDDDGVLKILAIGNSFSVDSMEYVYQVAKDAGIDKIVLGNLYIGGCSLETHLSNAKGNKGAYTYYTNTEGTWKETGGVSIKTAVESDDWDFISMQQASGYSGISSTYATVNELIDIVEPLNPSARIVWHMTWAYQQSSGHSDFSKYGKIQATMYNAIIGSVKSNIVTNERIDTIIPAGTAIQNARTSFVGDTLTRDGYHLSKDLGRYIGSLTFVKALTGVSIDNVTYAPSGVDSDELAVAIEAANNACENPFKVTKSEMPERPLVDNGEVGKDIVIPDDYIQLDEVAMGLQLNSYHNSSGSDKVNGTDDWAKGFIRTKKFTKRELPVGSIIEIAEGWQYRPEGWTYTGTRPDNTNVYRIVVTEEWWGSYTTRAFNISKVTHVQGNEDINTLSAEEIADTVFKIYTPQPEVYYVSSDDCETEILEYNGKQYRALKADKMGLTQRAYYYSTSTGPEFHSRTDGTSADFWATGTFTEKTMPVGTLIWVDSGWQYRPECWTDSTKAYNGTRSGNIKTAYTVYDDSYWSNGIIIRAFNISRTDGTDIGTSQTLTAADIQAHFKIYIPVENIK